MIYGMDYLGGARYTDVILQHHPRGFAAGFFTNTFSDALPTIDKLAATGRCALFRLHLLWKDNHQFSPADFGAIINEAKRCNALIKKYPHFQWYLSGACEHNLSAADASKLAALVAQASPNAHYVNTPLSTGGIVPGVINEIHTKGSIRANPYSYSSDGASIEDMDIEQVKSDYKNAQFLMLWTANFNGKKEDNDTTPRPDRGAWPSGDLINSLTYIAQHSCGKVDLPKDWIWKSHAEYMPNDVRSNKPCLIAGAKADFAYLKLNGHVVDTLKFYGTYSTPGFYRYYSMQWGYNTSIAVKNQVCELWIGGAKRGDINPAFRTGVFH